MRICLLLPGLVAGGAEAVVLSQAREFTALGHEAVVMSLSTGGNMLHRFLDQGFTVRQFDLVTRFRVSPAWLSDRKRAVERLSRALAEKRPDVLHTHLMGPDLLGLRAGRKAGIKVVVHTIHNVYPQFRPHSLADTFRNIRRRRAYAQHDRLYAVTQEVREWTIECRMANRNHVEVIHNGIDLSHLDTSAARENIRKSLGWKEDEKVVLAVGSLTDQKNHVGLLSAAGQLLEMIGPYVLAIAGAGPLKSVIESKSVELPEGVRVELLGYRSDVPDLLKGADVFALVSFWEGLPIALLEALYAGIPVVASNIPVHRNVLEDGALGTLADPHEPSDIAHAIARALGESNDVKSMRRALAKRRIVDKYSSTRMAKDYLCSYRMLLAGKAA